MRKDQFQTDNDDYINSIKEYTDSNQTYVFVTGDSKFLSIWEIKNQNNSENKCNEYF